MKRPSRGLSPEEAELWARVARTITPMAGRAVPRKAEDAPGQAVAEPQAPHPPVFKRPVKAAAPIAPPPPERVADDKRALDRHGLDASWDRRLAKGLVGPDFTLDLHGSTLDAAHGRLNHGLTLALAQGARMVLLITGRPRPYDGQAGRGERRGAIRAKFLDWLEAGPHASRIAAIRPAHPRHGGAGAVYIVLRRGR